MFAERLGAFLSEGELAAIGLMREQFQVDVARTYQLSLLHHRGRASERRHVRQWMHGAVRLRNFYPRYCTHGDAIWPR